MPGRRPASGAASRCVRVTLFLASVGLALFAVPVTAQEGSAPASPDSVAADTPATNPPASEPPVQPPATSAGAPPSERNYFYAEVWTPRARTGEIHLHGGVFAPINANATSATLGVRIGLDLGSHVLLGVMGDWSYKSRNLLQPVTSELPGFEPQIVLAKVDAHLVPAMLFLQVKLTNKFFLVPYAGVGAGYEWLILRAQDFRTSEEVTATYANPAWQAYGGMGLRLSKGVRVDGELFYNGAVLGRDVSDQNGNLWRETVDANGVGARVGLNVVY